MILAALLAGSCLVGGPDVPRPPMDAWEFANQRTIEVRPDDRATGRSPMDHLWKTERRSGGATTARFVNRPTGIHHRGGTGELR